MTLEDELRQYTSLMDRFMAAQISADEFQQQYLAAFKNDPRIFTDDVFAVLNGLFGDCDFFNSNPALRGPSDLTEKQLLEACKGAYDTLRVLFHTYSEITALIISFNRALLGEVPWALRRVTAKMEKNLIRVQFVFDGPISDDDRDSAGCVAAEVVADFPRHTIDEEYLRIDEPQVIPFPGKEWRIIFQRKEPRGSTQ